MKNSGSRSNSTKKPASPRRTKTRSSRLRPSTRIQHFSLSSLLGNAAQSLKISLVREWGPMGECDVLTILPEQGPTVFLPALQLEVKGRISKIRWIKYGGYTFRVPVTYSFNPTIAKPK